MVRILTAAPLFRTPLLFICLQNIYCTGCLEYQHQHSKVYALKISHSRHAANKMMMQLPGLYRSKYKVLGERKTNSEKASQMRLCSPGRQGKEGHLKGRKKMHKDKVVKESLQNSGRW